MPAQSIISTCVRLKHDNSTATPKAMDDNNYPGVQVNFTQHAALFSSGFAHKHTTTPKASAGTEQRRVSGQSRPHRRRASSEMGREPIPRAVQSRSSTLS